MFNQAIIVGHLGKDPELRYTSNGIAVASFSLATSERWKGDDGEKKEKTTWHNVVAWRKLAEVIGELGFKGQLVMVVGKIEHRSYDDKEGVKRYVEEIVASEVKFLTWKEKFKETEPAPTPKQEKVGGTVTSPQTEAPPADSVGDLPF